MSTSDRPCHLSGSGRSALESSSNERTFTDSSPRRVRHHGALDTDPVAEIELVELLVRLRADLVARDEELHGAGLVAHRGERELALPADQQDPARDAHRRVGLGAGLEGAELVAELAERPIAVEANRVRVDALRAQLFDVGDPSRPLAGNVERGLLVGRIGHRRGS